jgi:hypothetical protein
VQTISVKVQPDHLQRLFASLSPLSAIAELIWNALDADAESVLVEVDRNQLGGDEAIRIVDDGHGLDHGDAVPAFQNLGGSKKADARRTRKGRILHGRLGKGRFRAFALGGHVEWRTRYLDDGKTLGYTINSTRANPGKFRVTDPAPADSKRTGTTVLITDPLKPSLALETPEVRQQLTEEFALYLRQYPSVKIAVCGQLLDPSLMQARASDYRLGPLRAADGREIDGSLTIIEWLHAPERALYLCDGDGFTLSKIAPGVQAPGYSFTAYLKSKYIGELHEGGNLVLEDLHPDLKKLLDAAKNQIKEHFRNRTAEDAQGTVDQWKKEEIYPFKGEPGSPIETAERQIFDVVALNVQAAMPSFEDIPNKERRFAFRLLREAIERSPQSLQLILDEVLGLPKEKQEELAELLKRTTLENIISATRVIADRLNFVEGLDSLVFEAENKKALLERRQLHRILASETWVFGEQYALTVSDRGLTEVLKKHLELTERTVLDDSPVTLIDDGKGILDLVLSRTIPQTNPTEHEHLVIELKRPSFKLDSESITQVEKYAFAIAADERFRDTTTSWSFWVVSNDYDDFVRQRASQSGQPRGQIYISEDKRLRISVRTWAILLDECRARLRFFQERLAYNATHESGLEYLRRTHEKYLPKHLSPKTGGEAS